MGTVIVQAILHNEITEGRYKGLYDQCLRDSKGDLSHQGVTPV